MLLFLCICNVQFSQAQTKQRKFKVTEVYLTYQLSSVTANVELYWPESIIPYGMEAGFQLYSNKRLSSTIAFSFRNTGNRVSEGYIFSQPGHYAGYTYSKKRELFFDIPVHLRYTIISKPVFKLTAVSGIRLNLYNYKYYDNPNRFGQKVSGAYTDLHLGLDIVLAHQQRHKTKRLSPLTDNFTPRADYLLLNKRSL